MLGQKMPIMTHNYCDLKKVKKLQFIMSIKFQYCDQWNLYRLQSTVPINRETEICHYQ